MLVEDEVTLCCDEFRSAYEVTFANPIAGTVGWLLYGTDHDTVSTGQPELRYWPIRYCPFCGTQLPHASTTMIHHPRSFASEGIGPPITPAVRARKDGGASSGR